MSEQESNVFAGEMLLLTSGEYSDYSVHVLVRALVDFDVQQAIGEYCALFPDQREHLGFDEYKYIAWLCERGLTEEVFYREYYLGDYKDIRDMRLQGRGPLEA